MQAEPLHAPPKPANSDPETGEAAKETAVPDLKEALQVPGHLMPAGLLVTVPLPLTATVNCGCWFDGLDPPPQATNTNKSQESTTSDRGRTAKKVRFIYFFQLSC
ncbi:MAG TPA: hypothetical protein VLC12_09130 [Terriglobales bacterium]|nr:hypothetical protein [Terriglobales bacterium]